MDIYIVNIGGKRKELTLSDIVNLIGTPDYLKLTIVDYKSSATNTN